MDEKQVSQAFGRVESVGDFQVFTFLIGTENTLSVSTVDDGTFQGATLGGSCTT